MEKQSNPPKGTPQYIVKFGEGLEVNLLEHLNPEQLGIVSEGEVDTPEEAPTGKENATLEGETFVKEEQPKEEVPKPEAPKEEVKPKEEPPPEPAKDEPYTLKIKVQGEEREVKLSKDELIKRVQLAEDYYKKTAEVAEMKRKLEPHLHVIEKPEYIDWLKEQRESGAIEREPVPPQPAAAEEYEYVKRTADADFEEIRNELRAYAATLPLRAQELLSSDHATFNREYDRIASERRARRNKPPETPAAPPPPAVDPKVQAKILESKEKAKEQAIVETPGAGQAEDTGKKEWKRKEKELVKRMRDGDREAAVELILHRGIFANQ